jgi:hypothetical protein
MVAVQAGTPMAVDGGKRCLFTSPMLTSWPASGFSIAFVLKNILGGVELARRGISPPFSFALPILSRPRPALIADQMDIFLKIGSGISLMIVMTGHQIHLV